MSPNISSEEFELTAIQNFEYAVYSLVEKPVFLCWADQNLSQALKDLRLSKEYVIGTKSDSCRCLLAIHMYGVGMLVGEDVDEDLGLSHFLDSADPSHTIETEVSTSHAFMWELWQLIDCILIRDVLRCRKVIYKCCYRYLGGVLGTYYAALAHYLAAIALLTMKFMKVEITLEEEALITKAKAMIEEYAEFAPGTFQCKSAFLDILQHRLTTHDRLEMLDKYDLALEKASAFGNYFDQSMLLESAFRWLRTFSPQRGLSYLRRSYDLYASWNCLKKVLLLETEFPWLTTVPASQSLPRPSIGESAAPTESNTISSYMPTHERFLSTSSHSHDFSMSRRRSSGAFHSHLLDHTPQIASLHGTISGSRNGSATEPNKLSELDIKTVLNASIQISQGIKVEEVLESLMRTVLLAAGADYGILALYTLEDTQAENLMLHMLADTDNLQLMNNIPALSRPDLLPLSVVRTVTATQKSIIRNSSDRDSLFDHSFSRDQYYVRRERQLKSVLCMSIPSTNQGKSRGILYLENNVTTSAFTQARVECLTLLCSQSAMTLERATVYQEMRSAKAQAEEATAQKSTFLANVSHEIRTPFNALLSCAIFLLDTSLTQMQKDYVLMIRDSATLTLSIIDGILDFSKIEQGMMDLVLSQFSITQNIEGALQVVAQKAGQAGVDLVYSREHADDQVIGDAHHLRQVILNLLGNAVKFTSDGCVKVTSATKTRVSDSRQILSVIVKDTGIGISPTGLERLFKAFSQVDASINRSYGGTGLGLAISKKLMELMGGKIWVQSVPGEGTSFHLEFPVDIDPSLSSNSASMEIEQSEELRKQGRLALVVTRFHSTADVLMDDLTRIGLLPDKNTEILDADSIAEAAKLKPYSIIFVDLQVDGALKLVQSLQKILYSAESLYKVVILTNHGSNIPKDMSSKRIVGYLMKPILKAKLRDIVSSALSKIGTAEDENSAGALGGGRDQLSTTEEAGEAQKPKQLRILLAEDNIINTRVALQHLKRLGFLNVAHAKDGIEVLEYCQKASEARNMYDIILMDVQMPRLDGIGATRELLKQYPERSTRPVIIALTANATSTDKEKCLEAGMNGHCSKPILPDQLLQTLSSITRRPSVVMT